MNRIAILFFISAALGLGSASTAFASACQGQPTGAPCSEPGLVGVCLDGTCRTICQGDDCFADGGTRVPIPDVANSDAGPAAAEPLDGATVDGDSPLDGAPIDRDLLDGGADDALPARSASPSVTPAAIPAPEAPGLVTPRADPGDPLIPEVRGSGFDQGCDFAPGGPAEGGLLALIVIALLLAFRAHLTD
ncbi:MAG TPA: hypothetical protein VII38_11520 [Polyangia bacterium]|jgi:hypothetical protein